MNILIVDDNAQWGHVAAALLAPVARRILFAGTFAAAATALARPDAPEVVLLDLGLPDSTRDETVARIPSLVASGRRVVVVTGHEASPELTEEARKNGASCVLYKGDLELTAKLVACCGGKASHHGPAAFAAWVAAPFVAFWGFASFRGP